MTEHQLGHCLHCDLAAILNARLQAGDVSATQIMEVLMGLAAWTLLQGAKPGMLEKGIDLAGDMLAVKILELQAGANIHHTAGHG